MYGKKKSFCITLLKKELELILERSIYKYQQQCRKIYLYKMSSSLYNDIIKKKWKNDLKSAHKNSKMKIVSQIN